MKGMVAKSELGSFAYYGDKQSGSYRAFGKTAKKMQGSGFGFAYVGDIEIMQNYDETLQNPEATSIIFVDKIFGQTCRFEGTPDDKKGAKIWMNDVVAKIQGNFTEEVEAKKNTTEQAETTSNETNTTTKNT